MTWREFVTEVERRMREKGAPDTADVAWIDITWPSKESIHVGHEAVNNTMEIS